MPHPRTRRFDAVRRDLRDRGFDLESVDDGVVAAGGSLPATTADAPLAVVYPDDTAPLTIVSEVATAAREGSVPVLVVDEWTAADVRGVLAAVPFVADRRNGGRVFYDVQDRIQLRDDTYACVPTGPLQWLEAPADRDGAPIGADTAATGGAASDTDDPQLLLRVGDRTVAALDSVAALRCPGPATAAFPYRYDRTDGRFRVLEDEAVVGRYGSVRAMRTDGYRPAPLPLVPEHHVRSNGHLARSTVLARVEDGTIEYVSP